MHQKTHKIKCSFDISEYKNNYAITKEIPCSFQYSDYVEATYKGTVNPLLPSKIEVCNGTLKLDGNILPNATIYFYKPNIKTPNTIDYDTNHYTDGVNGVKNWHWNNTFEIHSENILVEKCKSDSNGHYIAFIPNGIYDIEIMYNNQKELIKNIQITEGLAEEVYYIIDGFIEHTIHSTIKMVNHIARNIDIGLLNEYEHFKNGKIIITQDNNLIVYRNINEHNMFALEPNIYDIKIRNDNTQLIIIKNFEFKEDFVDELIERLKEDGNLIFRSDGSNANNDNSIDDSEPVNDECNIYR